MIFCDFVTWASLFILCFWSIFSCFELSVLVQIAWKDSSPKWPIMCWVGCKTIHSHTWSQWHVENYIDVKKLLWTSRIKKLLFYVTTILDIANFTKNAALITGECLAFGFYSFSTSIRLSRYMHTHAKVNCHVLYVPKCIYKNSFLWYLLHFNLFFEQLVLFAA